MRCAWQEYLSILPVWMRQTVDEKGRHTLQELRIRINSEPELITSTGSVYLKRKAVKDDLLYCINVASKYSPWSAGTVAKGYITAPGGHRIGICGSAVVDNGNMTGFHFPTSLCLRVCRDFPGLTGSIRTHDDSVLIIGRPGSGKTTLLRDLIRNRSNNVAGSIAVVDEKGELFPVSCGVSIYEAGLRTDILTGCRKQEGIEAVLRNMGPDTIAVDEITAKEDCEALMHAGWCGVKLLATAHAADRKDLYSRDVYRPIVNSNLFDRIFVLHPDKSWHIERMHI